jgi:uncharacterized protein (UPF0210 family)
MSNPPIRTITLGIAEPHPVPPRIIQQAATTLQQAHERYTQAGYEVQTVRLSMRSIFDDLAQWPGSRIVAYATGLQRLFGDISTLAIEYCSLGTANASRPTFPLQQLELIPELLIPSSALNATVTLADEQHGLREEAAPHIAQIIQRLARETTGGLGNFRFAMLAHVPPGTPFFPAAYHSGAASLSIGLQGAGIVHEALDEQISTMMQGVDLSQVTRWIKEKLVQRASPIVTMAQQLAQENELLFGGIDLSPAPMGEDSIVSALELCGLGPFGTAGSVALVSAVTSALKGTSLPSCGYSGLMLPVMEDTALGKRWEEGFLNIHQLLLYSTICGTGLDTIPLPGNCSIEVISQLLLDVASLAQRLRKPLSARLFPVPGKEAGDYTNFTSPHLTNTLVKNV